MIDLEHCLILGRESIDSNSLNRCIFNLFTKMGEFNSNFVNASSENIPESPFFSGGYANALTDIDYVSSLSHATTADTNTEGLVMRLYSGTADLDNTTDSKSFITNAVTGAFMFDKSVLSGFAPTVDSLLREKTPLILKSFVNEESSEVSKTSTLEIPTSPTIKYTSYMLSGKTGISFGTITFDCNNGDSQKNEISIDIKSELIGVNGVDRIKFFTIGNGFSSGVKTISENYDMITDMGSCSVTYNSDSDIVISNITKNDVGEKIVIDNDTGRILDENEKYDYSKCTVLDNDIAVLNFFIIFELKDNVLEYSDDMWCFYLTDSQELGCKYLYNAKGWAENYTNETFSKFEAADDGKNLSDGSHFVWENEIGEGGVITKLGGCTTMATDAFKNCYNGTFESLRWFSPRLREADRMFQNCKLATFNSFPASLELDYLRNGRSMFQNCRTATFSKLENLSFKSSAKINYMFADCSQASFTLLKNITIAGNANEMFCNDYSAYFNSLTGINGSCTNFTSMFEGCDNATFTQFRVLSTDVIDSQIYANRMFYNLEKPKFDKIERIDFDSSNGYDGTSMFEGCINATFEELSSLGNIKNGKSMFKNLDKLDETEESGKATFSKLNSLGTKIQNGTEMFCNDKYLSVKITDENIPLEIGNSMFQNTSSVIITGNMNSLTDAENMFSQVMTAVVEGDINSLKDGQNMFSYCVSADLSGTANSLVNMNSMFYNSDYVHMAEVPSSATQIGASFAFISGNCYIKDWKPSNDTRYCTQTFENSNNVWLNGNILDGSIYDTTNMFNNCSKQSTSNPYLILNNPNMNDVTDVNHRYFTSDERSQYAFFQNYDETGFTRTPRMTFIGSCTNTEESLSSYAASSDVRNSVLCFESQDADGNTVYSVYTVNKTPSAADYVDDNIIKFYIDKINFGDSETVVQVYTLKSDGTSGEYYGTVEKNDENDTLSLTFKKNSDDTYSFQTLNTFPSRVYTSSDTPQIQTFTTVDNIKMPQTWKYATRMFHNVIQSSLLSGYECFLSESLNNTDSMFELDEYYPDDATFSNTGNLFRKMGRSKIQSMNSMFRNRYISNVGVFTDNYLEDYIHNISLMIPYSVVNASSAYQNCHFIENATPYVHIEIPSTLIGAEYMFDSFSGSKLRLQYNNGEWIYLNDDIKTTNMFRNCSFYNGDNQKYCISTPSIYLQMFNYSDFDMNSVQQFEFRNGKNIAYPYSDEDFFFNDDKIMGCSSLTFSSLENDITDWFNSYGTTTTNALNVEGVYFATIVGPKNVKDSDGNTIKNYELMTASLNHGTWDIDMSMEGQFTSEMRDELIASTNNVLTDNISSLYNENNRMTCMFNPQIMFLYSDTNSKLGDSLWKIMKNSEYSKVSEERIGSIGGNIRQCVNSCYTASNLSSVERINAHELPLAFMGLSSADFHNLVEIGDDIIAGYGAFMFCNNAVFDNLSSISVMETDSEDTFSSRFVDTEEERFAWFGNYNNMFYGDQKATFENLKNISFNTTNSVDSNGNTVRMWIDTDRNLLYSFVDDNGKTSIYNIVISTYLKAEDLKTYYKISIYDFEGNKVTDEKSYSLDYYTTIEVHENIEITYELAEINSVHSVIITMLDKNNQNKYIIASYNSIYSSPMHPINGYAKYDSKNFSVTPFISSIGGSSPSYYNQRFISLDGITYELETSPQDNYYTIDLKDTTNGTVMKLGTVYVDSDIQSKMWMSRLCYESDGINYIAITLFKSETTPTTPITYPSDSVCYRVYEYDGDHYVDELTVIPGTIEFKSLLKLESNVESVLSHKAFCSGMFKNCTTATFESLETINIPMTGSCAEMFANCTSINLSSGDMDMFILPISYTSENIQDHENYKMIFSGISTDNIKLDSLNTNNTNIYKLGKKTDSTGHHLIGEQLFDGMVIPNTNATGARIAGTRTADVSSEGNAFTYQNAIFDLRMDSELASNIFDRGRYHTVSYYDRFDTLLKKIEVEYETKDGNPVQYPVIIPKYPILEIPFKEWEFKNINGTLIYVATSSDTYYGPITQDLSAYAIYDNNEDIIVAHTYDYTEPTSSIVYHDDDTSAPIKPIVTSYNTVK